MVGPLIGVGDLCDKLNLINPNVTFKTVCAAYICPCHMSISG